MKREISVGEKITLVLRNEKGRRLSCVGLVIGKGHKGGPEVQIDDKAFKHPPKIELIEELIDPTPEGLTYRGEIGGAILVPSFLWLSP